MYEGLNVSGGFHSALHRLKCFAENFVIGPHTGGIRSFGYLIDLLVGPGHAEPAGLLGLSACLRCEVEKGLRAVYPGPNLLFK